MQSQTELDPDLAMEKYFKWLNGTAREDRLWPPATRGAWLKITQRLREQGKRALH